MTKALYVIAVKRERCSEVPCDWLDRLRQIEGLEPVGEPGVHRVLVEAHEDAIDQARELLGDYCHLEPVLDHGPMG